jgi:hypothetical protein
MRSTQKELFKKIREARSAVVEGRIAIIRQEAFAIDALELGYVVESELHEVLTQLLDETRPAHYAGGRPPQRSYEQEIKDLELFAFEVESKRFQCRIYLKFALACNLLWLVSLHESRGIRREA